MNNMYVETFITFEAAHRLYDVNTYSEECRNNIHGHSYGVNIKVSRTSLNESGMVIDFKLLKKIVNEIIELPYDHSCILRSIDPLAEPIKANCKKVHIVEDNPTAEWMAKEFFQSLDEGLKDVDPELYVLSVSVRETEHNIATYEGGLEDAN